MYLDQWALVGVVGGIIALLTWFAVSGSFPKDGFGWVVTVIVGGMFGGAATLMLALALGLAKPKPGGGGGGSADSPWENSRRR